jgi:hypothetical protein
VRTITSHTNTRTAASGFLNGRFSSNHHPFLLYLMAGGACKRFVEPPPKAAGITLGPDRSLIRPFFMPLSTEVSRRPLRAPVGPQLHYLTVHLVEGIAEPGLQPRSAVIGKVSGQSPRFFEKHAHVLQLR